MGSRYYITGVQLGMLISAIEYPDLKTMKQILKQIRTKQYVCNKEEFEKLITEVAPKEKSLCF